MISRFRQNGGKCSSVQMINSTIVRAHQHASGAKRGLIQESTGRSRGGQTTKIHLRTNTIGLPIAVTLSSGEASDYKGYEPLMLEPGPEPKSVDRRQRLRQRCHPRGSDRQKGRSQSSPCAGTARHKIPIDGAIYALRNLIERCFNKLKHSRRLATRYDKTTESYLGFVLIASARLWCRPFVNTA